MHLSAWKTSSNRKPLILRGARQVGKTTLIKQFAKKYNHFILLNLEKTADRHFFEELDDVKIIIDSLFLSHNITSNKIGETLLFIDESSLKTNKIKKVSFGSIFTFLN